MANIPEDVKRRFNSLLTTVGEAGLNALFPNDFEAYMMALELTDSNDNIIEYLAFPIMPKTFTQVSMNRVNVKQTFKGITTITSNSFSPKEVSMSGDFGRTFKFLAQQEIPAPAIRFSTQGGVQTLLQTTGQTIKSVVQSFNSTVKTGYGVTKLLEAIINKSTGVDSSGKPFRLYFHNPTRGESHLCVPKPNGLTINQNETNNRIHMYTLELTLIAPTVDVVGAAANKSSVLNRIKTQTIQRGVNLLAGAIRRLI